MFEISPKKGIDINLFNKVYIEYKDFLDFFINNIDELDEILVNYDYDIIYRLSLFLDLCEDNYISNKLRGALMLFLHQKEDELFLDLYLAQQENNVCDYLDSLSLSEIKIIREFLEKDKNSDLIFSDIYFTVLEKEKSRHI